MLVPCGGGLASKAASLATVKCGAADGIALTPIARIDIKYVRLGATRGAPQAS
ncbi:hypothetical protein [Thermobaculum terrenum]|uniref:hypothetical protein n=1 Tax=Thermobaculum terrenum TaxID=166501 RepID=UPI0002DFF0C4|nr:hypothetical protein [Thermobaculum terrenum]